MSPKERASIATNIIKHFVPAAASFPNAPCNTIENKIVEKETSAQEAGAITIGAEVEVRWRSYFPHLWRKYFLNGRRSYEQLSDYEKQKLTEECSRLEEGLLRNLQAIEKIGVPRGNDRYWEFAFLPVHHPATLIREISTLRGSHMIPERNRHSLHITIGGLPQSKDTGFLLMLLELLGYTSPERIKAGSVADRVATWDRKGRAGQRPRDPSVLLLGKTEGVEFRTLELPKDGSDVAQLIYTAWFFAESIRRPDMHWVWDEIVTELKSVGARYNFDVEYNWGKGYQNVDLWHRFADTLPKMDVSTLKSKVQEIITHHDKLSPQNKYLRT